MAHVGNIGQKITVDVTMVGVYSWVDYSFSYYGSTKYIYNMKDADGNVYVWKTSSCMSIKVNTDRNGNDVWHVIDKNDRIQITGTIKDHSIYKDEEQTVLNRCKFKLLERHITYEEKKASRQKEQYESLLDGDFIWEMPYKQYKEHYSDCETIYGSYDDHAEELRYTRNHIPATIEVIIRKGRLKASGVRGEHFSGYQMENELGQKCTYRAVSEENALKRVQKDFPEHTWKCTKIYNYQDYHRIW